MAPTSDPKTRPAFPALPSYDEMRLTDEVLAHVHRALRYPEPVPPDYERKDQASLTASEKQAFRDAIQQLMDTDTTDPAHPGWNQFDEVVNIHGNMGYRMHTLDGRHFLGLHGLSWPGGPDVHYVPGATPASGLYRFLPWHRAYLQHFEDVLRAIDPTIAIPYWDYTKDRGIPAWLADFLPQDMTDINGTRYDVTRDHDPPSQLPTEEEVHHVLNTHHTYTGFTVALEFGPHNKVHGWVGGTMNIARVSPADPLFWLHHANIDRLWAIWQEHNPGEHTVLLLDDARMDPWRTHYDDLRHTTQLGYTYDVMALNRPISDHPLVTAEEVARGGVAAAKAARRAAVRRADGAAAKAGAGAAAARGAATRATQRVPRR